VRSGPTLKRCQRKTGTDSFESGALPPGSHQACLRSATIDLAYFCTCAVRLELPSLSLGLPLRSGLLKAGNLSPLVSSPRRGPLSLAAPRHFLPITGEPPAARNAAIKKSSMLERSAISGVPPLRQPSGEGKWLRFAILRYGSTQAYDPGT
jgi:hypothetical protein